MTDVIITQRAYKFRLYPSHAQQTLLEQTLGLCCELYNAALQERRDAYQVARKSITYNEQQNQLPEIKNCRSELRTIHSQVLQDVLRRLDKAFDAFFRRVKTQNGKAGFPRFRHRARYDSFTYPQSGFVLKTKKLQLSKIGNLKIKKHRPLEGKIKGLTITRTATGKWYACFQVEQVRQPENQPTKTVGVDVGLKTFASFSDGTEIDNPRFFRQEENALAKAQRKLSTATKGSPERKKRRKVVARIHERITNKRKNFVHKLSHYLALTYGLIVFEKLNVKGMVRNHSLAKSIADASWTQLIQCTTYKAAEAGGRVLRVNPANTSKTTHCCGVRVEIILADRIIHCPQCQQSIDRDYNAALNILSLGLQTLGIQPIEAASLKGAE